MSILSNQPLSIGKLLDAGFKFYVFSLKKVIVISLLATVVPLALMLGILGTSAFMVLITGAPNPDVGDPAKFLATFGVAVLVAMIVGIAFYAALFYRLIAETNSTQLSLGEALAKGSKSAIPLIITTFLYMTACMIGSILLLIPGIILTLSLAFYMPAYIVDDEGIVGSLSKSHKLVWGNWWRTLAEVSVPVILLMAFYMGILFVFGFLAGFTTDESAAFKYQMIGQGIQYLCNIVLMPLIPAFMVVIYNDLKLRKEGIDLEQRITNVTTAQGG